jgi:hypothetical protein
MKKQLVPLTLQTVQSGSHKAKSLVLVRLSSGVLVSTSELNGTAEELLDVFGRCHDACTFVCNIVLHACLRIDRQLSFFINRSSQAFIILTGIDVLGVILGVVDVVLRTVAAQSFGSDLKLARAVTESHETENAEQEADGLSRNGLDSTDIDSLGIISKPVSEVDTRDVNFVELLAVEGLGLRQDQECVSDIAVAPFE